MSTASNGYKAKKHAYATATSFCSENVASFHVEGMGRDVSPTFITFSAVRFELGMKYGCKNHEAWLKQSNLLGARNEGSSRFIIHCEKRQKGLLGIRV